VRETLRTRGAAGDREMLLRTAACSSATDSSPAPARDLVAQARANLVSQLGKGSVSTGRGLPARGSVVTAADAAACQILGACVGAPGAICCGLVLRITRRFTATREKGNEHV
jgi:hypothetical protein